jgi:hypothetical protein
MKSRLFAITCRAGCDRPNACDYLLTSGMYGIGRAVGGSPMESANLRRGSWKRNTTWKMPCSWADF